MAITSSKLLNKSTAETNQKLVLSGSSGVVLSQKSVKNIASVKVNVIKIEKILKGTLASEKKSLDLDKREQSKKRRDKSEEKLETKPQAGKGKIKTPKLPRMGFLGWIKNFIGNIILGYFAIRLIKYLPKIKPLLKFLGNAADFVIDVGGKVLNGLVTFIDWGYKAIDFTKNALKTFGGENAAKTFDKFLGTVQTLVTVAIAASIATSSMGDSGGGLGDIITDFIGNKLKKKLAAKTLTSKLTGVAAKGTGLTVGTAAAIVGGVGLLASALGEGSFQVKKASQGFEKKVHEFGEGAKKDPNPITRTFKMATSAFVMPFLRFGNWMLNGIGVTLDILGAPFRYAIELIRYPFLSDEDKIKQAKNLAKFDARIRDGIREHFAGFLSPLLRLVGKKDWADGLDKKGSWGSLYGEKGTKGMGYRGGGSGGRTGPRRSVSKFRYKRKVVRKPGEVKFDNPGIDVGGESKILGLFSKPKSSGAGPLGTIKQTGKNLGKTDYFGPILAITAKILTGKKPERKDYENVGLGINQLISRGLSDGTLSGGLAAAFANGGMVDVQSIFATTEGGDITKWVGSTFEKSIKKSADKSLSDIAKEARKTGQSVNTSMLSDFSSASSGGSMGAVTGTNKEKWKAFYAMGQKAGAGYPELVAAQFALESGWGTKLAARNNFFGIKATASDTDVTVSRTREVINGKDVFLDERFKNFNEPQGAVNHLVTEWYKDYKGYKGVNNAPSALAAADQLRAEGYATDPAYAQALRRLLNQYSGITGSERDIGSIDVTSSSGGDIGDARLSGDGSPKAAKILAGAKKILGQENGVANGCARTTRSALAAGGLKEFGLTFKGGGGKTTKKGDLDIPVASSWTRGQEAAASFGGSDLGQIIRNKSQIKAGDIILWRQTTSSGKYNKHAITHVGIAANDGLTKQYDHSTRGGWQYRNHWDSYAGTNWFAGVRLMDEGGIINRMTPAILGESGKPEGVVGSKITQYLNEMAPGILPAIIGADSRQQLASVLQSINEYGFGPPDEVFVSADDVEEGDSFESDESSMAMAPMSFGGGSDDDPFEALYQGG
jgi:hypothetical protein|tara:strand:+ start:7845 stop:11027 length:3183 start_codon:yes stop_codon:yes gene_type:complete